MREPTDTLERALRSLAERVQFPPTPPIAPTVGARLRADAARAHRPPFAGVVAWPRRRLVIVVALALVLLGGAAVAARLAIGPVEVRIVPSLSPGAPPETPAAFGDEVPLARAGRLAGIEPAWPPGLGRPDDVYVVDTGGAGSAVVLAWRGEAGRIPDTPWTAVLIELRGDVQIATKYVGASGIHTARVDGRRAFWISGAHDLSLQGAFGGGTVRVSGSVLLWQPAPGLAYRLETTLPKPEAIALAETVR
jgi:hypothetical protein